MFDEEGRKIDLDTPRERALANLSVDDMQNYISWLMKEISRVEAEIEARGSKRAAAEALFS